MGAASPATDGSSPRCPGGCAPHPRYGYAGPLADAGRTMGAASPATDGSSPRCLGGHAPSPPRCAACYSRISVTAPDPTVRPPSRMANRSPFSMATGVISSTTIATLSPGITISTPSGNVATPVTSVVRR